VERGEEERGRAMRIRKKQWREVRRSEEEQCVLGKRIRKEK
jgi:hypothetical protein